jgi:hypothetical protein
MNQREKPEEDGVYFTYTEDNPIAFTLSTPMMAYSILRKESVKTY